MDTEERSLAQGVSIFDIAKGTEFEPKEKTKCPQPDIFLDYYGVAFGIGMDEKLYVREDGKWRKA